LIGKKPSILDFINRTTGFTPLISACQNKSLLIPLLLSKGADVNQRNFKFGDTPLHYFFKMGASLGDMKILQLLLDHGANPAIPNFASQTAKNYATKEAAPAEMVQLLTKYEKPFTLVEPKKPTELTPKTQNSESVKLETKPPTIFAVPPEPPVEDSDEVPPPPPM
jgi:hypothetical protein